MYVLTMLLETDSNPAPEIIRFHFRPTMSPHAPERLYISTMFEHYGLDKGWFVVVRDGPKGFPRQPELLSVKFVHSFVP